MSHGSQWAVSLRYIKKDLADLPQQLGSRVFKARAHVFKTDDIIAIINLQDVRTYGYSAATVQRRSY
jgi:hypothetical protein